MDDGLRRVALLQHVFEWKEEKGCLINHSDLGHVLLNGKSCNGNHGDPSMLDFRQFHSLSTPFITRVKSQGVKTQISRKVKWIVLSRLCRSVRVNGRRHAETGTPKGWRN
jgi:hypothetical protein